MNTILSVMDMTQAQAWVLIIGAVGILAVQIINGINQGKASKSQGQKLDVIHTLTNERLSLSEEGLKIALARVDQLEKFITDDKLSGGLPEETKQTAQKAYPTKPQVPAYPEAANP